MAEPREQACSGERKGGAALCRVGLVLGTGNRVGFVPLLRTVPPCSLPEWEWAAPIEPGRASALCQSAPTCWLQILLGNALEICNFLLIAHVK